MVKIGYTTGVFDLFHIGHLNILRNAKLECNYLIVGVTTDELAMEAKGKKPVIPFDERMTIVESIKYVDCVVPQKPVTIRSRRGIILNSISCLSGTIGRELRNGTNSKKILPSSELRYIIFHIPNTRPARKSERL
jgi:cytidyltransferase-like protein